MARKTIKTIPSVVGLLLLVIIVFGGVYLTQRFKISTRTAAVGQPLSVKIANINSQEAVVYWLTEEPATGSIKLNNNEIFLDDRDKKNNSSQPKRYFTHYITIDNLKPGKNYHFTIIGEGQSYQNSSFQFTTGQSLSLPPQEANLAFGLILNQEGQPLPDCLITLSLAGATNLAAVTDKNGFWSTPLSTAYRKDLSGLVSYDHQSQIIEIIAEEKPGLLATMVTNTGNDHPAPPITIGKTYDFSAAPPTTPKIPEDFDWDSPEIAKEINGTSFLPSEKASEQESPKTVNISNPKEGETFLTTQPEFTGQGPAKQKIKIIIESPKRLEEELSISEFGSWEWTPPENLSAGEHTITIEWYDENNTLQAIKRSFTVQAASVSPTPTPITPLPTQPTKSPTPSPSPSPSPTSIIEVSPADTVPVVTAATTSTESAPSAEIISGNLTPLIILAILGLGLIHFAFTIPKKS
jgi:hypothetical protein